MGDGLNLIFLCICIEICEYVMSMIVVIIYIKVVIVCIMLLNKVKFYKFRLNFIVEKVENLRMLKIVFI